MASWKEIADEIGRIQRPDRFDVVRRRKLNELSQMTGRNLILYATDFLNQRKARILGSNELSIGLTDKDGFVEVIKNLSGENLDVILHSPGGNAEAAESIVDLFRHKFSDVRFIIPNAAKSAATMLAMSGNMLLMDERSELGPTDPQMIVNRDGQTVVAPAHDIKEQFKVAKEEVIKDPKNLTPWLPILRQYGPSLISQCDTSMNLSQTLVRTWLRKYMFAGDSRGRIKAQRIASYLTSKSRFKSHSRKVGIDDLISRGVKILDLRTNPALQTAVWDLYLTLQMTFDNTGAYKIFENQNGEALIRQIQVRQAANPISPPQPSTPQSTRRTR